MANCNGFEIGFKNPKDAVLSTLEGIEFFMRNEVTPKFDNWAVEPLVLVREEPIKGSAAGVFHRTLRGVLRSKEKVWSALATRSGEAGPGKCIVPATAFMDIGN